MFDGPLSPTWAQRLLEKCLTSVKFYGFNMCKIPAITNLGHFMNIGFYFRKDQVHFEDALEVDMMLGTAMISSKRNTQAVELLRNRVQAKYIAQIEHCLGMIQGRNECILSNDSK